MEKSYQKLNVLEYTKLIKDTMIPFYDNYDGEFITMLTPETIFTIKPQYCNKVLIGFNILANGELLETKSTQKKAIKYLKKLTAK